MLPTPDALCHISLTVPTAAITIEKMAGDIVIAATTMHRQLQKGRLVDQAIFQIALPSARREQILFE